MVQRQAASGSFSFLGGNEVYGDPWYGTFKCFTIVYGFNGAFHTATVQEHATIDLLSLVQAQVGGFLTSSGLVLYGATYGSADATSTVLRLYNAGTRNFAAENSVFGDSWPGTVKSMTIVYGKAGAAPST